MPPLNTCEEQADSYYSPSAPVSRLNSPFDDEDEDDFLDDELEEDIKDELEDSSGDKKPDRSLFLNFNADLNPQNTTKKPKPKKATTYKVNGVNILNRKSLDSKTVMERLKRRRENHNYVERKRRDNINHTIFEISQLIPHETTTSTKLNKGSILRLAADYIKEVQAENRRLTADLERCKTDGRTQPSEERVGYPMRPYAQLLHDQPNYPAHPPTRPSHESSHYRSSEHRESISAYQIGNGTPSGEAVGSYIVSQPSHQGQLANAQHSVLHSRPLHTPQPISYQQSQTHNPSQVYQSSNHASRHSHDPSIQSQSYPASSLPVSNISQANIAPQLYASRPMYGYTASSLPSAAHTLPPLYQSAQQQRKGMMFNEFSGTLNLF
ncbi:hypothetical protein K7432_014632 [Basidiobolus ranarum]|uniref:BHLH domain-containing protein n=1 Tax=Basidiobolus ranarum TaxID=34480 RepID=A0ABR2VP75_9FUNG